MKEIRLSQCWCLCHFPPESVLLSNDLLPLATGAAVTGRDTKHSLLNSLKHDSFLFYCVITLKVVTLIPKTCFEINKDNNRETFVVFSC